MLKGQRQSVIDERPKEVIVVDGNSTDGTREQVIVFGKKRQEHLMQKELQLLQNIF